LKFFYI